MNRFLRIWTALLALLLLGACATSPPEPAPAPTPTPTPEPELVCVTEEEDRMRFETSDGAAILNITLSPWTFQDLDPFWPDIAALLAPETEHFGPEELAQLAWEDYQKNPAAFSSNGWSITPVAFAYLDDEYQKLNIQPRITAFRLRTSVTLYELQHSRLEYREGGAAAFADLFTVDRQTAAERVLDCVLALNEEIGLEDYVDPDYLTEAFDPERVIPEPLGLTVWYPYEPKAGPGWDRSQRSPLSYRILYEQLGDILAPVADEPLLGVRGEDIYYILTEEGEVCPVGIDEYLESGDMHLAWGRNDMFRIENAYQNPVWAAIQARYTGEADRIREDVKRQAQRNAERYWSDTEQQRKWTTYGGSGGINIYGTCVGGRYLSVDVYASLWENSSTASLGGGIEAHQVYDLETGEQVGFRDLFDAPDKAERAAMDYMQANGCTQEQLTAALEPEHMYLWYDCIVLCCPAREPTPREAERMAELEPMGFRFLQDITSEDKCEIPVSVFADCGLRYSVEE